MNCDEPRPARKWWQVFVQIPNHCWHNATVPRAGCKELGATDLVQRCCRCGKTKEWDL